ncbi:MAG: hypothetical protein M0Q94_11450 [Candidatus Cloacimonetes bacterium]|nr:hypothetical protein [Candidatus Cloacimonadota bacterium]
MDTRRVRFFSKEDYSVPAFLDRVAELLGNKELPDASIESLEELIEYYNCYRFFKAGIRGINWDEKQIAEFDRNQKVIPYLIDSFFSSWKTETINCEELDDDYIPDFWMMVCDFNNFKRWDEIQFAIISSETSLFILLQHEKIVKTFGSEIKKRMLCDNSGAELLIEQFGFEKSVTGKELFFPKELSPNERALMLDQYTESENPGLGYLQGIVLGIKKSSEINLEAKTRVKAQRRYDKLYAELELSSTIHYAGYKFEVQFVPALGVLHKEQMLKTEEGEDWFLIQFNLDWLEQKMDNASILSNFIMVFEFADSMQYRLQLPQLFCEKGVMERTLGLQLKSSYSPGFAFGIKERFMLGEISLYSEFLQNHQKRLEDAIEYFFNCYLRDKFKVPNFCITMPSVHNSWYEKCVITFPQIESVLKQYQCFVREGVIDHQLISVDSSPTKVDSVPSLNQLKYIYCSPKGKKFGYCLCSDQSSFAYIDRVAQNYHSMKDLLDNETIRIADYSEYLQPAVKELIAENCISDEKGILKFTDIGIALSLLYNWESINYPRCDSMSRNIMDRMEKMGLVITKSTLLAKSEQDLFNYILNKAQFSDGMDLRNKYLHGDTDGKGKDNVIHHQNYLFALYLMISICIKISDDLSGFNFSRSGDKTDR